ncbi:hypothetical protein HMPREF1529_02167 [Microbacterium sp. oral taxon 186 str. F0373]|nr:hypothetical protein HMPREF1529_02167 [Microbacterium sp. oral taxon 186 str. F0373]
MHVRGMTSTPAAAPSTDKTTDAEAIIEVLKQHMSGPNGCTCGDAPEVFWERELHAHIAEVMLADGWTRAAQ